MSWTCDKCREMFAYEDEVTRYDINWNFSGDAERNAQNPDNHAHTLCMTCDELRMKREEIIAKWDGLSPRERDAWVAEAVFGYIVSRERRHNGLVYAFGSGGYNDICPAYTTDISAAWSVVERVIANNTAFRFTCGGGYYLAAFRDPVLAYCTEGDGTRLYIEEGGSTAPEAICLAALLAKLSS